MEMFQCPECNTTFLLCDLIQTTKCSRSFITEYCPKCIKKFNLIKLQKLIEKEIHFYESDDVFYLNQQKHTHSQEDFYIGYAETEDAIYMNEPVIHTLQMACLASHSLLFNANYHIFIHETNGEVYEIKLGTNNERTNREIKKSHNLLKMWMSGEFKKEV